MNPKLRPGESGEVEISTGRLFPGGRVGAPPPLTHSQRERLRPIQQALAALAKLEHRAVADKGHAYGETVVRFEGKLEGIREAQRELDAIAAMVRREP